ncbi:MAG: hypothetical protein SFV23_07470 [Planctomycetaceae bacterium]|nr:hypothetical protein [Planctomycetaceae bacterium]
MSSTSKLRRRATPDDRNCGPVVCRAAAALLIAGLSLCAAEPRDEHRMESTAEIERDAAATVTSATAAIDKDPKSLRHFSQRGDAYFFLGKFREAVSDYDQMVVLNPAEDAGHWRRGIAYFYAKRYADAAGQFERYHSFDNVDRENGIWRYLSQVKAYGRDKAREGLLKYEKDDREPFPAVYELFAGRTTPEAILQGIAAAEVSAEEREKRLFYAHLYIGLNEAIEERPDTALRHLRKAAANSWGPTAGYGPRYMWQVARLHARLLTEAPAPAQ